MLKLQSEFFNIVAFVRIGWTSFRVLSLQLKSVPIFESRTNGEWEVCCQFCLQSVYLWVINMQKIQHEEIKLTGDEVHNRHIWLKFQLNSFKGCFLHMCVLSHKENTINQSGVWSTNYTLKHNGWGLLCDPSQVVYMKHLHEGSNLIWSIRNLHAFPCELPCHYVKLWCWCHKCFFKSWLFGFFMKSKSDKYLRSDRNKM